jgi:hypothetical protein
MDNMVIYSSIHEHCQSIRPVKIEDESREISMRNQITLGKSISAFGKTFSGSFALVNTSTIGGCSVNLIVSWLIGAAGGTSTFTVDGNG